MSHRQHYPHRQRRQYFMLGTALAAILAGTVACSSDSNTVPATATTITANSGSDAQTGTVGTTLAEPVSVHVSDQNGNELPGAVVSWTVASGGGSVSASTDTTDATGNAAVTWTLGTTAGANTLNASLANGTSVTINATATAGAAAQLTASTSDTTALAAADTGTVTVHAADQYGNAVANVGITWTSSGGVLSAGTATTDASGNASVQFVPGTAGSYVVTATTDAGLTVSFLINAS